MCRFLYLWNMQSYKKEYQPTEQLPFHILVWRTSITIVLWAADYVLSEQFWIKKEKDMAEVQEIIEQISTIAEDSVKIANFAEQLVENNPKLAESLEFILGVELQEKHRREEDANKI